MFKSSNKIYNNFKYIEKNDLDEILNHTYDLKGNLNLSSVMYHDLDTWIPNDILLRNDKIYANKAIEVRVPFLDKDIIENFLMISDFKKFGLFFRNKNILMKSYKKVLKMTTKKKLGFNNAKFGDKYNL